MTIVKEAFDNVKISNRKKEPKKSVANIVNKLSESELGADLIKDVSNLGYSIKLVKGIDDVGYCDSDKKCLALNPAYPEHALVFVLAHEARHALQAEKIVLADANLSLDSMTALERIKEADADAFAGIIAWQLKEKSPEIWETFSKDRKYVATPIENSTKTEKDVNKVLSKAFEGWFNDKFVIDSYTASSLAYIKAVSEEEVFSDKRCFGKQIPLAKMIKSVCANKNKNYFSGNLDNPLFFTIADKYFKKIEKIFDDRKTKFGIETKGLQTIRQANHNLKNKTTTLVASINKKKTR